MLYSFGGSADMIKKPDIGSYFRYIARYPAIRYKNYPSDTIPIFKALAMINAPCLFHAYFVVSVSMCIYVCVYLYLYAILFHIYAISLS